MELCFEYLANFMLCLARVWLHTRLYAAGGLTPDVFRPKAELLWFIVGSSMPVLSTSVLLAKLGASTSTVVLHIVPFFFICSLE